MGPLRRRAESTTERKTDIQIFYHVSEDLYSAVRDSISAKALWLADLLIANIRKRAVG